MGKRTRRMPAPGEPLVSTIHRAADLLSMPPERLAQAVKAAQLDPWGTHADGAPVYPWPALCSLAGELGHTPPRHAEYWRSYQAANRGRANRHAAQVEP